MQPEFPSVTQKLEIGAESIYVKIGFKIGSGGHEPWFIDITLGHGCEDSNARAMIEVICVQATELIQCDCWSFRSLISAWRGTKFRPDGPCPQLECIVSSPLDAVAQWVEERFVNTQGE